VYEMPRSHRLLQKYKTMENPMTKRIEAALRALAEHGLRCDMNPTHDMSSLYKSEAFWQGYLRMLDTNIRNFAASALRQIEAAPRGVTGNPWDWPEDFASENGNYSNTCLRCDQAFIGNKHRRLCKRCGSIPRTNSPAPVEAARCPNCDDTGDVHRADGEWLGRCNCATGKVDAAPSPPDSSPKRRFRHRKRGTTYEIVANAEDENNRIDLIVYRGEHDGKIWARPASQFFDGRFEALPASTVVGPADSSQGEPVAFGLFNEAIAWGATYEKVIPRHQWNQMRSEQAASFTARLTKSPSSPQVADGCAIVPRELTAENGAKAALIGEFVQRYVAACTECDGEGDNCSACEGSGTQEHSLDIDWTTIKEIWKAAVAHFAAAPQSAPKAAEPPCVDWEHGRYPGKITQHWLRVAFGRIAAGEPEREVLFDYGYVPEKVEEPQAVLIEPEARHWREAMWQFSNLSWNDESFYAMDRLARELAQAEQAAKDQP
jgi:hypothetical protein